MNTVTAKNISCTAQAGVIHSIVIKDKAITGFPGKAEVSAGLSLSARWSSGGTHLICDISLTRISGSSSDEGWFSIRIPYYAKQAQLTVWTAKEGFPKSLYEVGGMNLIYGDVCYGTVIPAVSLYHREEGIGLTVARAPGRIGGRLSFRFGDYHQEGMYVEMNSLEVGPDKPFHCRLLFFGHDACWRPGLRQYAELYKEYFEPVNPAVWNCRSYIMTNPFFRREATAQLQCDWAEIHSHFPYYGNYLPEEASWESIIAHDYPKDAVGRDLTLTRQKIRNHIHDLHDAGIKALYYMQCGGDAYIPWVEKTFPDSIARDSAGHPYPTWINCCFANSDAGTEFGKFLISQLDRVLEIYPELDGIFADQLCYQAFDYAHSDGRSIRDGCRVYEYGACLEENFRKLARKVHEKGKLLLVNGPFDMDVARDADAIMSEGCGSIFETYRYLCIRKPMLIHEFPQNVFNAECMLRSCLLTAAGWSVGGTASLDAPPEWNPEVTGLYQKYLPLVKALSDAELLLEPDPIRWEPGPLAKAEIFRSKTNGHILVSVLQNSGYLHSGIKVSIRSSLQGNASARMLLLGKPDWESVEFTRDNDWLVFQFPAAFSAGVLELVPAEDCP